ncbi:MAG: tRNA-dihydrouridine synthase, partial [Endomicrobia bacterium]|nr:tRNA-dihydrouridine synthase [Endomicrobiia bacterium]
TAEILESVVKSAGIPVTVKIRIGLLPGQNVAPEIIKIAENSGVKMVAVHARPASQGHSGDPDIAAFAEACAGANIPVIANGGIVDEVGAEKFFNVPNCSGLMIGRGAIGNYSIFKRLERFFNDGIVLQQPSFSEKIEWFKKHAAAASRYYGGQKGYVLMRKVAHYYIAGMPNAAKIRDAFNKVTSDEDFKRVIDLIKHA